MPLLGSDLDHGTGIGSLISWNKSGNSNAVRTGKQWFGKDNLPIPACKSIIRISVQAV